MASYKFTVDSAAGPVQAVADGDGSLEIFDLDVDYEQGVIEFYYGVSTAYALYALWDRLTDVLVFRYVPRYDIMEELARFISKCPDIVGYNLLPVFARNEEPLETYHVHAAVTSMMLASFDRLDEQRCLDLARFFRAIGVHVDIEAQNYDTKPLDGQALLLREFHYLDINNNIYLGPWTRYSKCEYTDIFLFNKKSTAATVDDDPDTSRGHRFSREQVCLIDRIVDVLGIEDYPASDACLFTNDRPRPCSIGVLGGYAVLYYPLRPHAKTPYSISRSTPTMMEYPDLDEAQKGYKLACEIDEYHGRFYDIRLMKRVSPQYGEDYENWEIMSKKKQRRMGSFLDWLNQYWEEQV